MNLVVSLLLDDKVVINAIKKRPKLYRHVHYFLNNGYRHLYGSNSSNCLYVIASGLLPALLAYENITKNIGDLFDSTSSPHGKRRRLVLRKNEYTDIKSAFDFMCALIERYIPDLLVGNDSLDIQERDKIDKRLYAIVQEYAKSALKRNRGHLNSFWVYASFYYKHPPDFELPLIPSADNPLQLIPFTVADINRLDNLLLDMLDSFCRKNRVINALLQNVENEDSKVDEFEGSFYYTKDLVHYSPLDFAEKCKFPDVAKDELVRDPFAYSLNIESWENLLYFNTKSHVLEYIPRRMAYYLAIVKIYYRVFDLVRQGEDDLDLLGDSLKLGLKFYISNVHLFLPCIYERNGQITENAEYLLSGFRAFKRNSPSRLISRRGKNIWQDSISAGMRRRGREFW